MLIPIALAAWLGFVYNSLWRAGVFGGETHPQGLVGLVCGGCRQEVEALEGFWLENEDTNLCVYRQVSTAK